MHWPKGTYPATPMHANPRFEASVPLWGHICSRIVGRAFSFQLPPAPSPAIACELGAILATSMETQKFPEKALLKYICVYILKSLLTGTFGNAPTFFFLPHCHPLQAERAMGGVYRTSPC